MTEVARFLWLNFLTPLRISRPNEENPEPVRGRGQLHPKTPTPAAWGLGSSQ